MTSIADQRLLQRLAHEFSDFDLFRLALTHRSSGSDNNERLEFLGDSILNFTVAEWLYQQFPEAREGQLSRLRAYMVKGETLADIARELNLGPSLRLGEGEKKSGGFRRDSILADVVEALIGAIYMDAGMDAARRCILTWFDSRLQQLQLDTQRKDPKTELQEYLQGLGAPLPDYQVAEVLGEAHAQRFVVKCRVAPLQEPTSGTASSRRAAEKLAAAAALRLLRETGNG